VWLSVANKDSASAVYPCANYAKRKIANRKAAIIHHHNAVDYKQGCSAIKKGVGTHTK